MKKLFRKEYDVLYNYLLYFNCEEGETIRKTPWHDYRNFLPSFVVFVNRRQHEIEVSHFTLFPLLPSKFEIKLFYEQAKFVLFEKHNHVMIDFGRKCGVCGKEWREIRSENSITR